MTLSTAEALRKVQAIGRPVLCVDACAVLDIAREPMRDAYTAGHVAAVREMLELAEANPPEVSVLMCEIVRAEIIEHLDQVEKECTASLEKLDGGVERIASIFTAMGLPVAAPAKLSASGFPAAARGMVERLLSAAHVVEDEAQAKVRAMNRVSQSIAPARRAKQSAKDCLIVETYLHVAHGLRATEFSQRVTFLTSNIADFCSGPGRKLHEDLVPQFHGVGMEFLCDWVAARYALRSAK